MSGSVHRSEIRNHSIVNPATETAWTKKKTQAILEALTSFVHNQARKHGVQASQVRDLIRDEALDPQGWL